MNTDIAYSRATPEAERTVQVPEQGWHLVQDGDVQEVKAARTDHTVCICLDGRHHASWHRYPARAGHIPKAELERLYPNGHRLSREIAWTNWIVQ